MIKPSLFVGAAIVAALTPHIASAADLSPENPIIQSIREESLRPVGDGYPLPLIGSWNIGIFHYTWPNRPRGCDPLWQLEQIEAGRRYLPTFAMPGYDFDEQKFAPYLYPPFERVAKYRLPFVLLSTQWERVLTNLDRFKTLPPEQNPNVVMPNGEILEKVDPFGPTEHWVEAGKLWTHHATMQRLQELYPEPPKIVFLSNNEHTKLSWHEAEESKRYLDLHGPGKSDAYKRKVFGDAWIEKYRALQQGMREGLVNETWRKNAIFIGYGGDVGMEALGRWGQWARYSLHSPGRFSVAPYMWDGVSPSYYMHNWAGITDYQVMSNQIESMNTVFGLEETYKINPSFWFELSLWDGDEDNPKRGVKSKVAGFREAGQTYDMERYRGWLQFGMWQLRPRVMRLYENWITPLEDFTESLDQIYQITEVVHRNATLQEFWRKGTLLANPKGIHPYQHEIPNEIAIKPRWFLLDTDQTPPRPWALTTEIPVYALALVLGEAPTRRWLLYTHAPLQAYKDVTITIPHWNDVKVDVPREGAFYQILESDSSITPISTSL